jgi:hypothetical protein
MVLYIPGAGSEPVIVEQYLINGWYQSCGYSGCDCPQYTMGVPQGWHPDPTWNECATKYCCGGHGGCGNCIMTQSQIIADYQTEVTFISNPPGAQIFINGVEWWPGAVTAADGATFRGIYPAAAPFLHAYEMRMQGYISATGAFGLTLDTPITISRTLVPLASLGDVIIESIPPGAEIWLAPTGQTLVDQGVATVQGGTTISNLLEGPYDYRLTLVGYQDVIGSFDIIGGQATILGPITMIRSCTLVTLSSDKTSVNIGEMVTFTINTEPTTDTYTVELKDQDENLIGTCITSEGTCQVIWYTAGSTTVDKSFIITASVVDQPQCISDVQTVDINIPLGSIAIISIPPGARIYIDNTDIGINSSALITDITPFVTHSIRLTLSGFEDFTDDIYVSPGITSVTFAILTPLVPPIETGNLSVTSTPNGVSFGTETGHSGIAPQTISDITVGIHGYEAYLDENYSYAVGTFEIKSGQTTNVHIPLVLMTPDMGYALIETIPLGADIYIDGNSIGTKSSFLATLPAGLHTYELILAGYKTETGNFSVTAGDQTITIISKVLEPQAQAGGAGMLFGIVGIAALGMMMTSKHDSKMSTIGNIR